MLTPRLLDCPDCDNIPRLIGEIDCKISQIGGDLYNSIIFGFKGTCNTNDLGDLIRYKRILMTILNNPYFGNEYDPYIFCLSEIVSKIKLMSSGCIIQECCDTCEPHEYCTIDPLIVTAIQVSQDVFTPPFTETFN